MQASVVRGGPVQHMGNHNYIGLSFTLSILLIILLVLFSLLITECESYQHSVPKMDDIDGGLHTLLFSLLISSAPCPKLFLASI